MLQRALEHVRDDLHVAMRMPREAAACRHKVFIDHTQRAKSHVRRVAILAERKRVIAIEPVPPRAPALTAVADRDHVSPSLQFPTAAQLQLSQCNPRLNLMGSVA